MNCAQLSDETSRSLDTAQRWEVSMISLGSGQLCLIGVSLTVTQLITAQRGEQCRVVQLMHQVSLLLFKSHHSHVLEIFTVPDGYF